MLKVLIRDDGSYLDEESKIVMDFLSEAITQKYSQDNNNFGSHKIGVEIKKHKEDLIPYMTENDVKQLVAALVKPDKLDTTVSISINDEAVFSAKKGEILLDTLNLVDFLSVERKISLNDELREKHGKELLKYARCVLLITGEKGEDGSLLYQNESYVFYEKNDDFRITRKDDGAEILNTEGFTKEANYQDVIAVQKIKSMIEGIKNDEAHKPSLRC